MQQASREQQVDVDDDEGPGALVGVAFWRTYLRASFLVLVGEGILTLVYFVADQRVDHRDAVVALTLVAVLVSLCTFPFLGSIARRPWRVSFSFGTGLVSGLILVICCSLDGGVDNPLIYLLALPVLSATLALPFSWVLMVSIASMAEAGVLWFFDPSINAVDERFISVVALLGGTIALALLAARGRISHEVANANERVRLAKLAATDPLTGCANQGAFNTRLSEEVARAVRYERPLSLLIADIDFFKIFNDTYGHMEGDQALKLVASVMQSTSRGADVVARVGGDEFAVIFPDTSVTDAEEVAHRIVSTVNRRSTAHLGLSIGIADIGPETVRPDQLFKIADTAMYRAKNEGRGHIEIATSEEVPTKARIKRSAGLKRTSQIVEAAQAKERMSHAILDSMIRDAPIGLAVIDRQYRYLHINETLAAINGLPVEEHLGRTPSEVIPDLWPLIAPLYREVLTRDVAVTGIEMTGVTSGVPRADRFWEASCYPLHLGDEVIGIGVAVLDITDRKRTEVAQDQLKDTMVRTLANAVETRDPYTAGHQERVAYIAGAIATHLGYDPALVKGIALAAAVHDVGKLSIPAEILSKPARLTPEEFALVRGHAEAGYRLLCDSGFPSDLADMVRQHHERLDGSGYPLNLVGEAICLGGRVIAVADVFEAMTAHRPYRGALGSERAKAALVEGRGTLFQSEVVDACLYLFGSGAAGHGSDKVVA